MPADPPMAWLYNYLCAEVFDHQAQIFLFVLGAMRRGAEMRIDVVKLSTSPVADWSVSKTAAEFSTAAWLEKPTSKFCFCGRTFLFRPEIR